MLMSCLVIVIQVSYSQSFCLLLVPSLVFAKRGFSDKDRELHWFMDRNSNVL